MIRAVSQGGKVLSRRAAGTGIESVALSRPYGSWWKEDRNTESRLDKLPFHSVPLPERIRKIPQCRIGIRAPFRISHRCLAVCEPDFERKTNTPGKSIDGSVSTTGDKNSNCSDPVIGGGPSIASAPGGTPRAAASCSIRLRCVASSSPIHTLFCSGWGSTVSLEHAATATTKNRRLFIQVHVKCDCHPAEPRLAPHPTDQG